ncbi:hypothetical protein NQ315_007759 [Exocentrus adspersus]|uniref:Protein FAM114A2 n=1 Tax=Exocentrus adspersus TaxID=1586481 RepID=A0AAV8W8L3_9CUCU|nr:hypothetical protein NQ315_007759 [Exocentrus adspersus]
MESSDSDNFESADEDFEFEKFEKGSNTTKHHHPVPKSDTAKAAILIPKAPPSTDVNQNKKETSESETLTPEIVNSDKSKSEGSLIKDDEGNKQYQTKAVPQLEVAAKDTVKHDVEIEACDNSRGSNVTGDAQDPDDDSENLWNEGEGWGVDDESDNTAIPNVQGKEKMEASPKTAPIEEDAWSNEGWEIWESDSKEIMIPNPAKTDNQSNLDPKWKGWSNWGVSSILSTATQSVSTLTSSVSQGLSTVASTIESSIGAPEPAELALSNRAEKKSLPAEITSSDHNNKNSMGFGLSNIGSLVSGVSKLVESTSTKVISGGLDTLETIGKKTMEVIQEGDPGLKKKRAFLNLEGEKPVLSQVLREAKEKAEQENKARQEKHFAKKVNYESIFDDHQGLVHLEALEMLSKQCDMKLQLLFESSSGDALMEIQETLAQVKELCELPNEEDEEQLSLEELKERLASAVKELDVNITYDRLISMWEETECWLNNVNLSICDENELHQQAVETLAQLTAIAVEQFHKAGELLLIKDHHSTADEADSLVQLTTTLTSLIGIAASKFSDKMNCKAVGDSNKESVNSLITNIFYEAANSSSYIQDAFQLLVPVIEMGAV